jgi:L-alanine-DL-glutamate epimerase-like enolase superfamily enzyme
MSDTYKAVFKCEALDERVVWYVSSREEARKQLQYHIKSWRFKKLKKYQDVEYTFTIKKVFGDDIEVHYDAVNSWGR